MDALKPKSHAEAVAVFRHGVIGTLTQAELDRGQLAAALTQLAAQRFRPPGADATRSYSAPTLERWYYAFRKRGLVGLTPLPRRDRGRAQDVPDALRRLLCDIRRERPSASASLILRTLVADGRMHEGAVSASTVRRLFRQEGLDKVALRDSAGSRTRLRWQAERPMALWHGDVCHGSALEVGGKARPLRVHALLDDASRYVVALEAHHSEREVDMLGLFVRALRRHGKPDALYLDNGATYRGDTLATACARLGISLLHAKPYDAPARGKMERFWRTLREGCLDFLGPVATLHDVNVRLWAFLDAHYHQAAHASLVGRSPASVFRAHPSAPDGLDEKALADALTVRIRRRVRRDTTVALDGVDYELDAGHLAGRLVFICRTLADVSAAPWVEVDGQRLPLHPVDAVGNSRRERPYRKPHLEETAPRHPAFEPAGALLDKAVGRRPAHASWDGGDE
ncbi:DDE-type integrase/transposase/recombinase [Corallococcus exiguus]|nr:DDE-type integrase/transposase/recombinase [Corallococcus exiguus]